MKTVTITEVRKRFNSIDTRLLKDVAEDVVCVTRKGKPCFYICSVEFAETWLAVEGFVSIGEGSDDES